MDAEPGWHTDSEKPFLTVMVPVFNEEESIPVLYGRLTAAMMDYGKTYELLFVDDGSTDNSFRLLKGLYDKDPHVRVVRFSRNFGQQLALSAGLRYARGAATVIIDADLQTMPEEIPMLVEKLGEDYDLVYGMRTHRRDPFWRRLGSRGMSWMLRRLTGIDIPDSASGFLALRGTFVEKVNLFNEKSKYFSGLFAWLSYGRWTVVPVSHAARHAGHSKYNFRKLVSLSLSCLCNYSIVPLRVSIYIGAPLFSLSLLAILGLVLATFSSGPFPFLETGLILAALGLFSSLQLICIGILGEYLARTYREVKEQPLYVVREVLDHARPAPCDAFTP